MTRPASRSTLLAGQTAWIFSDGKAGHEAQCLGVVEALGLDAEIKPVRPMGIPRVLAPWGPVAKQDRLRLLQNPYPAFAFATGRTTIPYIRALKRAAGLATYTVILMDPKTSAASADLIWVPEHDRRRGANVISTVTAPHRYSQARLEALRRSIPPWIAALPRPRIACLIGGPNGDYRYTPQDEARLVQALADLAAQGFGLMITSSRRTPDRLVERMRDAVHGSSAFFWDGTGQNPYPDMLAHADMFLITADSVSMACEAAGTGRPIYIFSPSGGSAKFTRFHAALARYGASRALPDKGAALENWTYAPLHSADVIADEVVRRWQKRAAMLPGLVRP